MNCKYPKIIIAITTSLFLSACSSIKSNGPSGEQLNLFPMASAIQVSYQDEVNLLQVNELLAKKKNLTRKQKSVLFYQRGLLYDRMGLNGHSRFDFMQSINENPTYAPAYDALGLYLLSVHSYDEAFEAFDSAIELNSKIKLSYLHRAVGLSEVGREDLAISDVEQFYQSDKQDPYAVIWRYLINSQVDEKAALSFLKTAKKAEKDKRFAWEIVQTLSGKMSESALLDDTVVNIASNKEQAERLCEVYFYLASWHRLKGNRDKAIYYYKLSTATNVREFIEYKYSYIALASIQKELMEEYQKAQLESLNVEKE